MQSALLPIRRWMKPPIRDAGAIIAATKAGRPGDGGSDHPKRASLRIAREL
jgi:hypothetical protein